MVIHKLMLECIDHISQPSHGKKASFFIWAFWPFVAKNWNKGTKL